MKALIMSVVVLLIMKEKIGNSYMYHKFECIIDII